MADSLDKSRALWLNARLVQALRAELGGMKLRALTRHAQRMGVTEEKLDDANSTGDIIALILEIAATQRSPAGAASHSRGLEGAGSEPEPEQESYGAAPSTSATVESHGTAMESAAHDDVFRLVHAVQPVADRVRQRCIRGPDGQPALAENPRGVHVKATVRVFDDAGAPGAGIRLGWEGLATERRGWRRLQVELAAVRAAPADVAPALARDARAIEEAIRGRGALLLRGRCRGLGRQQRERNHQMRCSSHLPPPARRKRRLFSVPATLSLSSAVGYRLCCPLRPLHRCSCTHPAIESQLL